MADKVCEHYEDLLAAYPTGASQQEMAATDEANGTRVRFFRSVRYLLRNRFAFSGIIPDPPDPPLTPKELAADLLHGLEDSEKANFLAVAGVLLANNFTDPLVGKSDETLGSDDIKKDKDDAGHPVRIARRFVEATVDAVQEYNAHKDLYQQVYLILKDEGTVENDDGGGKNPSKTSTVYARQIAEVTDRLVEQNVSAGDPQLRRKVLNALATALGSSIDGRTSQIDIVALDLEEGAQAEVIRDNVVALSGIYPAAMLEELKFFATADKIAEQFTVGMVPVTRGAGGELIYQYIKSAPNRITEVERRSLYARAFGLAQGAVEEPLPNREFNDLWIRFLSAVSIASREKEATVRKAVSEQQVLKSGRDLAVGLSLHGYGMAHFAAVELQTLIKTVKQILSAPDILAAFGVKDCWQLTERVSALYLGGSVNSVRQRTMAQSGAKIIKWLADNGQQLSNQRPGSLPSDDLSLVAEVENWLAVTGTNDSTVDQFSEPVAIQSQRTIPDFSQQMVPDSLRDALSKMNTMTGAQLPQA